MYISLTQSIKQLLVNNAPLTVSHVAVFVLTEEDGVLYLDDKQGDNTCARADIVTGKPVPQLHKTTLRDKRVHTKTIGGVFTATYCLQLHQEKKYSNSNRVLTTLEQSILEQQPQRVGLSSGGGIRPKAQKES